MFRIMVIDDKEVFLRVVSRMPLFNNNASKVKVAWTLRSADQALSLLRNDQVDIVITDIRMPKMSGLDLLRVIQREKLCNCTILMSEYTEFSYARQGILLGAFDYMVKPLDEDSFETAIARAVRYLEKLETMRKKDTVSSEKLFRMLLFSSKEELSEKFSQIEEQQLRKMDPEEILQIVEQVRKQLLDSFSANYPYLERYLPIKELLSAPLPGEPEDAASAFLRLKESLLFLHRKLPLFYTKSENRQVQNIWYYTIMNADSPCRLADTAGRFFLNTSYLSSLFRKETGISYKSFVQELKMERARYLLGFSSLRIFEIAALLNFTDAEYFRKSFKASSGMSPAKFDYVDYIRRTIQ